MIVLIRGPQGSGKTTLARRIIECAPNAVFLPELSAKTALRHIKNARAKDDRRLIVLETNDPAAKIIVDDSILILSTRYTDAADA